MKKLPRIDPIIVKTKKEPFDDEESLFELKYDGYRAMLYWNGKNCWLISRNNIPLNFYKFEKELALIMGPKPVILDGELVVMNKEGRTIFNQLHRRQGPYSYIAFDILFLGDEKLTDLPLFKRKEILAKFAKGKFQVGTYFKGIGKDFFQKITELDLEGMVAKKLTGIYSPYTKWHKVINPNYSQKKGRERVFGRRFKKK